MALIEARDLTKVFQVPHQREGLRGSLRQLLDRDSESRVAVDHVSFSVDLGESVAYVGPNGAGKSTTIKMLAGVLIPTDGTVLVNGLIPYRQRAQHTRSISVVFGQRTQLWWDIPVVESLRLLKDIYGVSEEHYQKNMSLFQDVLGLGELLHRPVRQLSLGQRMRCDLAAAFLHDPAVVFLDEPTIGLDVSVKDRIRHFINDMNRQRGTTVLLTTHDLGDVEDLCRRIIIIDKGRVLWDGLLADFRERFATTRVLRFQLATSTLGAGPVAELTLPTTAHATWSSGNVLAVHFDRRATTAAEVTASVMRQVEVLDFSAQEEGIEPVIKALYEGTFSLSTVEA